MCAAMCAQRNDRARTIVPLLRKNVAECEANLDDGVAFTHTARHFHELLVTSAGNHTVGLVVRSLESLWTSQEETWAESMTSRGDYFSMEQRTAVVSAHTAITDRIEKGDSAAVERAVRRHAAETQDLFLARFTDQVIDASSIRAVRGMRSGGRMAV
jgi:DNA-binding FadR family transcriptional regulator